MTPKFILLSCAIFFTISQVSAQELFKPCCNTKLFDGLRDSEIIDVNYKADYSDKVITRKAEIINGLVIVEGDIIIAKATDIHEKAAILNVASAVWPDSFIPFIIEPTHPDINMIYYAINHVNEHSNISMVARTTQADYVKFVDPGNATCNSFIGMIGGEQIINVSPQCGVGATIHEILHAAGHHHEQSRADRDNYVTIELGNVKPGLEFNFNKYVTGADIGVYDINSIMHYDQFAFSDNGCQTISIINPPGNDHSDIGQLIGMSTGDIAAVNSVYTAAPVDPTFAVPPNYSILDYGTLSIVGKTVTLSGVVVKNTGTSAFTKDTIITLNEVSPAGYFALVGETIPILAAGATYNVPDLTVDKTGAPFGIYTYSVWVDPFGYTAEGNEGDNYHFWTSPRYSHCPDEYSQANSNQLTGIQSIDASYQTDGHIESSQIITSPTAGEPTVVYDTGTFVELVEDFEVQLGALFKVIIDGCGKLF